jgi:chaperonin GroES
MAYEKPSQDQLELQGSTNDVNLAEKLDQEKLDDLAGKLLKSINDDERTMKDWNDRYKDYLKLAMQIKENKQFPWRNAANVKYPLLTIASLQFHARAYPALVSNKGLVKGKVVGYDPSGEKANKAERVGKHMTYMFMDKMRCWDEEMDKLLLTLPIAGCMFKKVFWDGFEQEICSELVFPQDVVVNYWARSLDTARRITHKIPMYENDIIERKRDKFYVDVELSPPQLQKSDIESDKRSGLSQVSTTNDDSVPYEVLECYTYLDLDDDGYKEPYIVTMERQNVKILRISPNFDTATIKKNAKGEVVRIRPTRTWVKFDFIPAPDGGLLGVGFGLLLGSLNETVNTSINQLIDQGTMYTTGGGFIAKGIRLKGGRMEFEPNEWKVVQTTGDDLRKGVFPLPIKEPSQVLFQMLQALVASGKEIIAISEIATGKLPGQNTPATTTLTSVEEGMKLFTAIYKRCHRSLKAEFRRVFELLATHLDEQEYFTVLDPAGNPAESVQVGKADYNVDDCDVVPESDPNAASDALKLIKAEALTQLIPLGGVDPVKASARIMEAMDIPRWQELAPQPQPNPEMMKAQADMQSKQMDGQIKQQQAQMELYIKQKELEFKEREAQMKLQMKMVELKLKEMEGALGLQQKQQQASMDFQVAQDDRIANQQMNDDKIQQSREQHQVSLQQTKEKAKLKNEQAKKSGSNRPARSGKLA